MGPKIGKSSIITDCYENIRVKMLLWIHNQRRESRREREVDLRAERGQVLERVRHHVRERRLGRNADLTAQGRDVLHRGAELRHHNLVRDVEHSTVEDSTVVIHRDHLHPVLERLDAHLREQHLDAIDLS